MIAQAISETRATVGILASAGIFTTLGYLFGYLHRFYSERNR